MISDLPLEEEKEKQQDPENQDPVETEDQEVQASSPQEDESTIEEASGKTDDLEDKKNIIQSEEKEDMEVGSIKPDTKDKSEERSTEILELKKPLITATGLKVRPDIYDGEFYSLEDYEEFSKLYDDTFANIAEGEVVQGTVMKVQGNSVILDVGFKSEGAVPLEEFTDPETVSEGDKVDVYLENLEDQEGVIVFSKKKADFLKVWDNIKQSYDSDEPIEGVISRKIKGGMVVNVLGVDAFLPGSQIDLRRVNDLDSLVGEQHLFKIIKLNKRRRNVVVSRRIILEEQRDTQRQKLLDEIEVGQIREGDVKNITDFGAFIDLGGVDGLLHITDMSWGRISHPSELVTIGDTLKIKILDIDIDRGRISLGLKQLTPYPWENIEEKYPVGQKVRGKVVSLTNYGAFVELEKGVEGLVHVSEMSWTRHIRHPSKMLAIGDIIEAVILNVDPSEEKISLGIKQVEADPWLTLSEKYPPETQIEGKVRNLTSFGGFVEIEEGIDGLVHVSDMSWTKRIMHPSEVLKKGDRVKVVVLNIDTENRRISLGLKQVQDDPWEELSGTYAEGNEATGKIARTLDKGLVVDLGEDVEGFVPISQVIRKTSKPLDQEFSNGDTLALRVLECDSENRRIVLSVVEILSQIEKKPVEPQAPESAEAEIAEESVAEAESAEAETAEEPVAEAESTEAETSEEQVAEAESAEAETAEEPVAEPKSAEAETAEEPITEVESAEAETAEEAVAEAESTEPETAEEPVAEAESAEAETAEEAVAEAESTEPETAEEPVAEAESAEAETAEEPIAEEEVTEPEVAEPVVVEAETEEPMTEEMPEEASVTEPDEAESKTEVEEEKPSTAEEDEEKSE
jgi:small subunit ribosomal protein S1